MKMDVQKLDKSIFGFEYEEIVVRDNRGKIVGYALLDSRDPTYENERKQTLVEFKSDFLK